jgi:hypothetical protein
MPVEIRELVIRAVIADPRNQNSKAKDGKEPTKDKEAVIEEAVRQVLRILKQKGER